jgi:glycosyltransferase involved in cell wall biosynthesis
MMNVSVVIPTCNRKSNLLALLNNLNNSTFPLYEVIVIDSGEEKLQTAEYSMFKNLNIQYINSEKSVCIQRNIGIQKAVSPWIFLCDDDIEMPNDYLQKLTTHLNLHPDTGAVSGCWLQPEKDEWRATYPENSAMELFWKFIFQLSIWGEINCAANNILIKKIKQYYNSKGNHISKAGWPVITDFSGEYFTTPVYSLGASLIKKKWLLDSPFDEVLDRHGIGDNYGVILSFPGTCIHVLNNTFVYHHQSPINRLQKPMQYYRRTLALDYFIKTKDRLKKTKTRWLVWSLTGNLIRFISSANRMMIKATFRLIIVIVAGNNPYYKAAKERRKVEEPIL